MSPYNHIIICFLLLQRVHHPLGDFGDEGLRIVLFLVFEGRWVKTAVRQTGFLPTVAEDVVRANVAVFHLEARIVDPPLFLQREEFFFLRLGEVADVADLLRKDQHVAVRVQHFGVPVRLLGSFAPAHGPVVGQDHDLRFVDELQDRIGEFLPARNGVFRDRDFTEVDLDFRQTARRDRLTSDPKRGGKRRMAVNDRLDFRTLFHDRQVEADLARRLAFSGELFPVHVNHAEVVGGHEPLGNHGRRADHFVFTDSETDVSIVSGRVAAFVQAIADRANVLFDLVNIPHELIPLS